MRRIKKLLFLPLVLIACLSIFVSCAVATAPSDDSSAGSSPTESASGSSSSSQEETGDSSSSGGLKNGGNYEANG